MKQTLSTNPRSKEEIKFTLLSLDPVTVNVLPKFDTEMSRQNNFNVTKTEANDIDTRS